MNGGTIKVWDRGAHWRVLSDWRDRLCGPAAPDWFTLDQDARATQIKAGNRRTIWRVEWDGRTVYAKVADRPRSSIRSRLKEWLIGTPVEREWRACLAAEKRSVPVVHALAPGVRNRHHAGTVFLSEGLTDAIPLTELWERRVTPMSGTDRRHKTNDLIHILARLFAESHERGFIHQDAHPNNILVTTTPDGVNEAVFVDVHSARITNRPASYRDTLRALAHFDQYFQRRANRPERLRFFRRYWSLRPALAATGANQRRRLADLVEAKARHAGSLASQRDRRLRRDETEFWIADNAER